MLPAAADARAPRGVAGCCVGRPPPGSVLQARASPSPSVWGPTRLAERPRGPRLLWGAVRGHACAAGHRLSCPCHTTAPAVRGRVTRGLPCWRARVPCGRPARGPGLPGGVGAEPPGLVSDAEGLRRRPRLAGAAFRAPGPPRWRPRLGVHCGSTRPAAPCCRRASLAPQGGAGIPGVTRCLPEGARTHAGGRPSSRRLWSPGPASLRHRVSPAPRPARKRSLQRDPAGHSIPSECDTEKASLGTRGTAPGWVPQPCGGVRAEGSRPHTVSPAGWGQGRARPWD